MGPIPETPSAGRIDLVPVYQEQFISNKTIVLIIFLAQTCKKIIIYIERLQHLKLPPENGGPLLL